MDQNVHNFIMTIDPNIDLNNRNLFWNLVNNIDSNGDLELSFIKKHPDILPMKIKNSTVFDFFYEKAVYNICQPKDIDSWNDVLAEVITQLNLIKNGGIIKFNKKYILKLQSTSRSLTDIFGLLVTDEFEMGDPELLVYSIIARGELSKLQILSNLYVIEDYPGVLDVALRYGRYTIINYFLDTLKLDIQYYGKIMDFEN